MLFNDFRQRRVMNGINAFHWIHGLIFLAFAIVHAWSWFRGGFWVPRYVHAIALVSLIIGLLVTATLPPSTNPNPAIQFIAPMILPVLFVVSPYIVAICCGYVDVARRIRREMDGSEINEPNV